MSFALFDFTITDTDRPIIALGKSMYSLCALLAVTRLLRGGRGISPERLLAEFGLRRSGDEEE